VTLIRTIGVAPGVICGIGVIDWDSNEPEVASAHVLQCDSGLCLAVVASLIEEAPGHVGVAIEHYVSGLTQDGGAAGLTRSLVEHLIRLADERADAWWSWPAHQVRSWATDERMHAGGLASLANGMALHGLDGLRHALYAAVRDGGLRDPLSRRGFRKPPPPGTPPVPSVRAGRLTHRFALSHPHIEQTTGV